MPVVARTDSSCVISESRMALAPVPGRCLAALAGASAAVRGACSSSVFHAPHPGHLPIQRGVSYPHALHIYTVFSLAMANLLSNMGLLYHTWLCMQSAAIRDILQTHPFWINLTLIDSLFFLYNGHMNSISEVQSG